MGNRFALVVAAFLLPLYSCASAPTPRTSPGVTAPDSDSLLASLKAYEDDLKSFRGIGKLRFVINGEQQISRVAWIGSQPAHLRVETLGLWGQPNLIMLVKGSKFYVYDRGQDRCFEAKATARNLSRLVSIPLGAKELFVLLSGHIPVLPFHHAGMEYSEREDRWCLCLYKKGKRLVERLWMRDAGKTVDRIEVFDGSGHLEYMASFKGFEDVQDVAMARKIVVSDGQGHVLSLEVESFSANVEVPAEAYTLQGTCWSDKGS
jgi:hypothetical protein